MSHGQDIGYSIKKIFIALFVLTAVEVAWGFLFRDPRWLLWGGLIIFAFAKGLLILWYFMHMKFEKLIVWSLILPTPLLILIVLSALMPDVSFNSQRDHPVGYMLDRGEVTDVLQFSAPGHAGKHSGDVEGAAEGAAEGH
jgi:cytochrome c oxidase subunit IV